MREVEIGSSAFWCPETPNYIVGVSAELVILAGHSRTFVWAMPAGEPLAVWSRRDLHRAVAIARDGDDVLVDLPERRLRLALATGETRAEEAAVAVAPARYAVDHPDGVRVHDAATKALVYTAPRHGSAALSTDGRYLVVSMLGPQRTWIVDVDRGVMVTPPQPAGIYTVTLGHPELVVVDDGVWSVAEASGPRRIATVDAGGAYRAIRGDRIVGRVLRGLGRWRLRDGVRDGHVDLPARSAYSVSVDQAGRFAVLTLDDSHGLLADFPDGVWIADLDAGSLVRIADANGPAVASIAPAADAVAIVDWRGESVRIVDRAGVELRCPAVPATLRWSQFAPDGERLLVVGHVSTEDDRLDGAPGVEMAYLVDRSGAVATVGAGTWRGWHGDTLVRRVGDILEQIDPASGRVLATADVESAPTRVWIDDHRTAMASNDGCLRLRDLVWRTVPP